MVDVEEEADVTDSTRLGEGRRVCYRRLRFYIGLPVLVPCIMGSAVGVVAMYPNRKNGNGRACKVGQ